MRFTVGRKAGDCRVSRLVFFLPRVSTMSRAILNGVLAPGDVIDGNLIEPSLGRSRYFIPDALYHCG